MRSWTKTLSALVVVWAVAVTAATQDGRAARQPTRQTDQFRGQVVSASGAVAVGGPATNPGHPVAGATVHLVPVAAIDTTTRITASAIYASPYPAEAYRRAARGRDSAPRSRVPAAPRPTRRATSSLRPCPTASTSFT